MPLSSFTGQLGSSRAAHLLRRATFGGNSADIATFATLTPAAAIAILFAEEQPELTLPINPETGTGWLAGEPLGEEVGLRDLNNPLLSWMVGLAADTNLPLSFSAREKIVFFLHTHFTTQAEKVRNSRHLYHQIALFRYFAFDKYLPAELNFRSLIEKVSIDNAMLRFLDGSQNVKGSPNENYARELLELYAIGRGLEGSFPTDLDQGDYVNYTEQDVQAAARVLSGLKLDENLVTIDEDTLLPRGRVATGSHDNDPKQFSFRFNDQVISPDPLLLNGTLATEESILDEVRQLVEMVTSQDEAARFICRKLYRFYVYHEIDDNLHNTIIQGMADTLIANNYKLQPVIEELLQSEHFYDAILPSTDDDKYGAIIKSPLDLIVGTLRFFNLQLADPISEYDLFYAQMGSFRQQLDRMGMYYYEPFEVAGYAAYHQYPAFNRNWISSNYLTNRYDFINSLFEEMVNQNPDMPGLDIIQFTRDNFTPAQTAEARNLIIAYIEKLFPMHQNLTFEAGSDDNSGLTAERLNYFLQAFLFEPQIDNDPEAEWTVRWTNGFDTATVERQLLNLLNALLQTPEYQLM
jgi:uncharacterized protein (DUF1800 family)